MKFRVDVFGHVDEQSCGSYPRLAIKKAIDRNEVDHIDTIMEDGAVGNTLQNR